MWVQISAGLAPVESCRFVYLFLKRLQQECRDLQIKVELTEMKEGSEKSTIKSVLLRLMGSKAGEYAKSIEGSLLWVCKSEYRTNHKRSNWYIEVEIFDDNKPPNFKAGDIKIETFRASGNGGQNVNKLETGVRITHLSTGIAVTAQEERSQLQNKKLALQRLQKKLDGLLIGQQKEFDQNRWGQHQKIKRGEPVRTFKGRDFKEVKGTGFRS